MNMEKIKQHFRKLILQMGVVGLISAISYAFIVAAPYVENRMGIGIYVSIMFILLPVATYVLISLYIWVLEPKSMSIKIPPKNWETNI